MSNWTENSLEAIDKADDLRIAPYREDGKTIGTPTWIWEVVVDGGLYVRAYNGQHSRWYQAAITQKKGQITANGVTYDVTFETVDDAPLNAKIDAAYQHKYHNSAYMAHMIRDATKAATIKIIKAA